MANVTITTMAAATVPLAGSESMEMSQLSGSVLKTGTTLSAVASDQSLNDSAVGFGTAGFAVGDRVNVVGFANGVNNLYTGQIATLTTGKMTFATGSGIINESAGATVTITKWTTKRASVKDVGAGSNTSYVAAGSITSASGTLTLDLSKNSNFYTTLHENVTTLTLSNLQSGKANFFTLMVEQNGTGGYTVALPASWKHPSGTAYVASSAAGAIDLVQGITYDGGTTWLITYARAYA